jgi:DNA anti-recombination protein RmuC
MSEKYMHEAGQFQAAHSRPKSQRSGGLPTPNLRILACQAKKLRLPTPKSHPPGRNSIDNLALVFGTPDAVLVLPQSLEEEAMSAEEAQKTLKQELEETRADLRRSADEIRVKLHLAGMDAKDAWNDLQPRLAEFERRFDAKAEEVGEELKALGSEIKKRLQSIKAKLAE